MAIVCEHDSIQSQTTFESRGVQGPANYPRIINPPATREAIDPFLEPASARPGLCEEPGGLGSEQFADNSANPLMSDVRILTHLDEHFNDAGFVRNMTFDKSLGVYRLNGQVVIPNSQELKQRVISLCHDHEWAGHPGISKTYDWLRRHFY